MIRPVFVSSESDEEQCEEFLFMRFMEFAYLALLLVN